MDLSPEVASLLRQAECEELFTKEGARLKCTLNGHCIPLNNTGALERFIRGKKFKNLASLHRDAQQLQKFEPFLVPSTRLRGHLFCALTGQLIKANLVAARQHMKGQRFLKGKERFMEDDMDLLEESEAEAAKPARRAHHRLRRGADAPADAVRSGEPLRGAHPPSDDVCHAGVDHMLESESGSEGSMQPAAGDVEEEERDGDSDREPSSAEDGAASGEDMAGGGSGGGAASKGKAMGNVPSAAVAAAVGGADKAVRGGGSGDGAQAGKGSKRKRQRSAGEDAERAERAGQEKRPGLAPHKHRLKVSRGGAEVPIGRAPEAVPRVRKMRKAHGSECAARGPRLPNKTSTPVMADATVTGAAKVKRGRQKKAAS